MLFARALAAVRFLKYALVLAGDAAFARRSVLCTDALHFETSTDGTCSGEVKENVSGCGKEVRSEATTRAGIDSAFEPSKIVFVVARQQHREKQDISQ